MKPGNWIFASALLVLAIVLAMPAAAQNDNAIVQAAKQKASDKKSGHVYTDEDFPGTQASSATGTTDSGNEATGSTTEDTSPDPKSNKADAKTGNKETGGKSADSAKGADDEKLKELEAKLADAKNGEQDLQRKLATLQQKAESTQDEFRKKMYQDMIANQQVSLEQFRETQQSLAAQIEQEKNKNQDKGSDQEKKTAEP